MSFSNVADVFLARRFYALHDWSSVWKRYNTDEFHNKQFTAFEIHLELVVVVFSVNSSSHRTHSYTNQHSLFYRSCVIRSVS